MLDRNDWFAKTLLILPDNFGGVMAPPSFLDSGR
jgi:hypothetical protein